VLTQWSLLSQHPPGHEAALHVLPASAPPAPVPVLVLVLPVLVLLLAL
jgi:hypothetical protein